MNTMFVLGADPTLRSVFPLMPATSRSSSPKDSSTGCTDAYKRLAADVATSLLASFLNSVWPISRSRFCMACLSACRETNRSVALLE